MTPAIVALAVGIAIGALLHRRLTRRPPTPAEQITNSYWAGYRLGHTDGVRTATAVERTPSPN